MKKILEAMLMLCVAGCGATQVLVTQGEKNNAEPAVISSPTPDATSDETVQPPATKLAASGVQQTVPTEQRSAWQAQIDRAINSVFRITIASQEKVREQTAFLLDLHPEKALYWYLVTAGHGFRNAQAGKQPFRVSVHLWGEEKVIPLTDIVRLDREHDFAIVQVKREIFHKQPVVFQVCQDGGRYLYQDVWAAGFTGYEAPTLCKYVLASITRNFQTRGGKIYRNYFQLSGGVFLSGGFSGAPVFTFDENGYAVAIGIVTLGQENAAHVLGCLSNTACYLATAQAPLR